MARKCIICGAPQKKTSTLSFHQFPKNKERRLKWLKACRLTENDIKSSTLICSKHFLIDDYDEWKWQKRELLISAVPAPSFSNVISNKIRVLEKVSNSNAEYLKENSITAGEEEISTSQVIANDSPPYIGDLKTEDCSAGEEEISTSVVIANDSPCYVDNLKTGDCSPEEQETSSSPEMATGSLHYEDDLNSEHCSAGDQQRSTSPGIATGFPRYVGDLKPEHFFTPKKCKISLELVHKTADIQRKKLKVLQEQKRRLEKRIASFKELLEVLTESNMLSEDASQEIMNFWGFR